MNEPEYPTPMEETTPAAEYAPQVAEALPMAYLPDGSGRRTPVANVVPHDFRNPVHLVAGDLRRLRQHHESFVLSLGSRLSNYLRSEVGMVLSQFVTQTYEAFLQELSEPCHVSLFKVEPLRGTCLVDVHPNLGQIMVERLLGGAGRMPEIMRDLSEIEVALLDQALQIIAGEWCGVWSKVADLKAISLGYESNRAFLNTAAPDTVLLVVGIQTQIGECAETIRIALPYSSVEPLFHRMSAASDHMETPKAPEATPASQWKPEYAEVPISVSAEVHGLQLTAQETAQLDVGDVIDLPPDFNSLLTLRVGGVPKFTGNLGSSEGRWAVQITGRARR